MVKPWFVRLGVAVAVSSVCAATSVAQEGMEGVTKITNTETSYPNWSPDGKRIVFHSDRLDNNWEIYIMDADGSHLERLTHTKADDLTLVWSPDGRHVAYVEQLSPTQANVNVSNRDGGGAHVVSASMGLNTEPRWSPDGRRIIFTSDQSGKPELYAVNPDGSGLSKLMDNPPEYSVSSASWSRDNARILFQMEREGTIDIYSTAL